MHALKLYLRKSNFSARIVTFAMIPIFFRIFISLGKLWTHGEITKSLIVFGVTGILTGSFLGHILYYRWIFPEK